MTLERLPLVGYIVESGPADPVFDGLLLLGPLVVLLAAVLGRSVVTQSLAAAYVAVFVAHVLYNSAR